MNHTITDAEIEKLREVLDIAVNDYLAGGFVDCAQHVRDNIAILDTIATQSKQAEQGAMTGWQMVPKEPTLEMLDRTGYTRMTNLEIWREMLAAAPTPPDVQSVDEGQSK